MSSKGSIALYFKGMEFNDYGCGMVFEMPHCGDLSAREQQEVFAMFSPIMNTVVVSRCLALKTSGVNR